MHTDPFWHVPVRRRLLWAVLLFTLGWAVAGCGQPDVPISAAAQNPQVQATATPTGPELDATNQADEDIVRHARETAYALPRTPDLNAIPPTPATTPSGRVQTGIFKVCSDSDEVLNLEITNCWLDAVNGEYVWVDAGARLDDLTAGRIELYTNTLSGAKGLPRQGYDTPQNKGAVRILSVTGERVLLAYPDNSTIIFNVITRQWEDAGSTPVPTSVTPTPAGGTACGVYMVDGMTNTFIEAERFVTLSGDFVQVSDSARSNGAAMTVPTGTSNPNTAITFNLNVTNGGTFYVWLLGSGPDTMADSFSVQVDGGAEVRAPVIAGSWDWKEISSTITLTSGTHTFAITERERGAQVDKILFTQDNDYTPTGLGEPALTCQ